MSEGNHASWQLRYHILGGSLNLLASRDAFDSFFSTNVFLPLKIDSPDSAFSARKEHANAKGIKLYHTYTSLYTLTIHA